MIKIKTFILLLVLLTMTIGAYADSQGYTIKAWRYEATVHKDNTWDVTETMDVFYDEPRHGIYRYIPRIFMQQHPAADSTMTEYTYRTEIDNVSVDGYEYETRSNDDEADNLVIIIGSEDKVVVGMQRYVIKYKLQYPDDRYRGNDVFYHSVLGSDCSTTIDDFSFRIRFDKPLPLKQLGDCFVYSGPWGTTTDALQLSDSCHIYEHEIVGHATSIRPRNGITLLAQLPEGFYEGAATVSTMPMQVAFGLSVAFLLITLMLQINNHRYRPALQTEYVAPDGLSSAEVGTIIDDSADLSDLTSLIPWFASKGYITITEVEGKKKLFGKNDSDLELHKLNDMPDDAPMYQKLFMHALFGKKDTVKLSRLGDRHTQISKALLALQREFKGERKLTQAKPTIWLAFMAFLLSSTIFFGTSSSVETCNGETWAFAMLAWAAPLFFAVLLRAAFSAYDMIVRRIWIWLQLIVIALGAAGCLILYDTLYTPANYLGPELPGIIIIAGGCFVALMGARTYKDTEYRQQMMSKLLGFREFIEIAEKPQLQALVDEMPEYFYDVLPYAMVFGLTDKWRRHFKDIQITDPSWYSSTNNINTLTGYTLADRLSHQFTHSVKDQIQVSSHAPSSTGNGGGGSFSGGGFAGGGGGGGGVGSW